MNREVGGVAVCVLFFERLGQTLECMSSFLDSGMRVYVLNNGSSGGARRELGEFCGKSRDAVIFDSDRNLGVAGGRNYLINHTGEEWLLFVDNDIVMKTSGWLEGFRRHVVENSDVEVFIPKLFNKHENTYVAYSSVKLDGKRVHYDKNVEKGRINMFPGGASFVKRSLFDRVGLYDDGMFVGFEDFELCIRALISGAPVKALLVDDVELVHDHRPVAGEEDVRAVSTRYDFGRLESSFKRISEKHGVVFDDSWELWVAGERERLIGGGLKAGLTNLLWKLKLAKRRGLAAVFRSLLRRLRL